MILKIEQAGGKYGTYDCPLCGAKADYKFSQNLGHCENCGKLVAYCGGVLMHVAGDKTKTTHWIECSIAG